MFLICYYFPIEPCNATKKNIRLSTMKTHYFISFICFLSSSAHRQPPGGVLQKTGSATVLKPIKKYLQRSSIFHQSCTLQVCNFTKVELLHSYFSQILNTVAAVYLRTRVYFCLHSFYGNEKMWIENFLLNSNHNLRLCVVKKRNKSKIKTTIQDSALIKKNQKQSPRGVR